MLSQQRYFAVTLIPWWRCRCEHLVVATRRPRARDPPWTPNAARSNRSNNTHTHAFIIIIIISRLSTHGSLRCSRIFLVEYLFISFFKAPPSTQFPRAKILGYRNFVWNGHDADSEFGNVSARQAALKRWTAADKRQNMNVISHGSVVASVKRLPICARNSCVLTLMGPSVSSATEKSHGCHWVICTCFFFWHLQFQRHWHWWWHSAADRRSPECRPLWSPKWHCARSSMAITSNVRSLAVVTNQTVWFLHARNAGVVIPTRSSTG